MRKSILAAAWLFFVLVTSTGAVFPQTANRSITKTDSPDPVAAGTNLQYTILVTNNGPNSATATTAILAATALTKAFSPTTIAAGDTTTLTFTLTNPAGNNPAQTVSFVDTLPAGLQIAANPNIQYTCTGVTGAVDAGSNTITVTTATVPASTAAASTCTISVNITNVPLQTGTCPNASFTNAASNISGTTNVANAVTASCVTVTTQTPVLNKAFIPRTINSGVTTTLTFTIANPATSNPAQTVSFTDMLPVGLRIATAPNVGGTCTGGTVTAPAGSNVVTVTGRTVRASTATAATCTITVRVTNVAGQLNASCTSNPAAFTNASGNISGLSNLTNAVTSSCVVVNGNTFTISKVASASSLLLNSPLSYTITVTNNGPSAADGSILTDPAVAGFTASGIACTNAINGAVCPSGANVTLANLQGAGIGLPTFPANSTLTFVLSGTFTQQIGSVANTATIATPTGVPLVTQSSTATVTAQTTAPATIPTLDEQALVILTLLLILAGVIYLRRGRATMQFSVVNNSGNESPTGLPDDLHPPHGRPSRNDGLPVRRVRPSVPPRPK